MRSFFLPSPFLSFCPLPIPPSGLPFLLFLFSSPFVPDQNEIVPDSAALQQWGKREELPVVLSYSYKLWQSFWPSSYFADTEKKIPHEFLQIAHSILEVCRSKKVGWRTCCPRCRRSLPPSTTAIISLSPHQASHRRRERMHPTNQPSPSRNSKSLPLFLPLFLPCGWVGRWCFEYTQSIKSTTTL